ncbi:tetratricopeptide repeat protein [Dactylosporangium sp. NPDC048998]|uniref:tetratricopeptide repeat protein n=1 Tax=Dactylosporangium sp. NPDC048998 TaxID=3363976 RepID=UPI0037115AA5
MVLTAYDRGLLAVQRQDYAAGRAVLETARDDVAALMLLARLAGDGLGEPADAQRKRALYERAAALGSAEAAYNLGAISANEERYADALDWYARAAQRGDAGALRMLGLMHLMGQGTAVDDAEAERLWLAAVEGGDTRALLDLGLLYLHHRDDPVTGTQWLLRAAKADSVAAWRELELVGPRLRARADGDDRAATLLGVVLAFHLGDPLAGVGVLEGPAGRGDPEAQRALAFLLHRNPAVEQDEARAMTLYRAAAEAGDAYAAYNLGVSAHDPQEAIRWLRQAAAAGITESYPSLGDRLSALDLDEEALSWYLRGAAHGHKGCMFAAACWFRDGFGGPVDLVQSLRWYLQMLDAGSGDGIHEAHKIVPRMSDDEIHEAGRLAGRILEADVFVAQRHDTVGR